MYVATVKIRNKRSKKIRTVNEREWARDLGRGKYSGWTLVGNETHGDEKEPAVWTAKPTESLAEVVATREEAVGIVTQIEEAESTVVEVSEPAITAGAEPLDPPTPTRRRRRSSTSTDE